MTGTCVLQCTFHNSKKLFLEPAIIPEVQITTIIKVSISARYDVRNEGRVRGLILVYLLMLIIHVTKHAST